MAIKQTIWSLDDKTELESSSLVDEKELEDLIADNISLISENWLVVGRQVRTSYNGIIDLLCIDAGGNTIVLELKRGMTPREVTAQALDYASWVKKIDSDELAQIYLKYSENQNSLGDAFLERFGSKLEDSNDSELQIVIVATDMDSSTERIIEFLQEYGININVLFFRVFQHGGKRFLSRAWMFEDSMGNNTGSLISHNWNGEYYFSFGAGKERSWEDAVNYGFVSAGGGAWYTGTTKKLNVGDRIWVNIPHQGYVGVGVIEEEAVPARQAVFRYNNEKKYFHELRLHGTYNRELAAEKEEYVVKVKWIKTIAQKKAVSEYGFFGNQNTVCRPKTEKWDFTINRLKKLWDLTD